MARHKKNNVDYFPHPVNNGSKMFVMEQTYGDKGYVAYYKLLEMIGREKGHCIDFKETKNLLFFAAQIRADRDLTYQILQTLAEVGAIDRDLWLQDQLVWCQAFVDKVEGLYDKRRQPVPKKPGDVDSCPRNTTTPDEPAPEKPQSKVKESKVNETQHGEAGEISRESLLEVYFTDLPNSEAFLNILRLQGIDRDTLLAYIPKFKTGGAEPSYPDFRAFVKHFGNWVRMKREDEKSKKTQTSTESFVLGAKPNRR